MSLELGSIRDEAVKLIEESDSPEKLDEIKVGFLGKKGRLTEILKSMKDLPAEERPKVGQKVNEVRALLEAKLEEKKKEMNRTLLQAKMKRETIDVTLP
ncbi:MAG TPA: phenylalanine--tRNA ligase subunit alpha, partial [Lachnospiraceae bacterium]|nr:phenylalanine--tRNA ligase subunit alpha [Lachnospiraceae bacterium]